jgi:hypothetical protein
MNGTNASLGIGALCILFGCARPADAPRANDGIPIAPDESAAIGDIAYARVVREQACHQLPAEGAGDVGARLTFLRDSTVAEIKPAWCKSNIHPRELEDCVATIRELPCSAELKSVTSIESCRATALCGVPDQGTM